MIRLALVVAGNLSSFDAAAFQTSLGAALSGAPAHITLTLLAASVAVTADVPAPATAQAREVMLSAVNGITESAAVASATLKIDVLSITSAAVVVYNKEKSKHTDLGAEGFSPGGTAGIAVACVVLNLTLCAAGAIWFEPAALRK